MAEIKTEPTAADREVGQLLEFDQYENFARAGDTSKDLATVKGLIPDNGWTELLVVDADKKYGEYERLFTAVKTVEGVNQLWILAVMEEGMVVDVRVTYTSETETAVSELSSGEKVTVPKIVSPPDGAIVTLIKDSQRILVHFDEGKRSVYARRNRIAE